MDLGLHVVHLALPTLSCKVATGPAREWPASMCICAGNTCQVHARGGVAGARGPAAARPSLPGSPVSRPAPVHAGVSGGFDACAQSGKCLSQDSLGLIRGSLVVSGWTELIPSYEHVSPLIAVCPQNACKTQGSCQLTLAFHGNYDCSAGGHKLDIRRMTARTELL